MAKTLVIAEKPSVARDLSNALPGSFKQAKDKSHLIGDDYVITWAVGHLVGLAEPDAYDDKLKKWRFADLPILPEHFKLVPNDDKSKKQLNAIHRLIKYDEVDRIVNACDAGREGELIFAYVFETANTDKPVQRLWLSSMTRKAIEDAFEHLRPGEEMEPLEAAAALALRGRLGGGHERHPRRVDPAARRVRRRGVAGPGADADAGAGRPPRGGDPRLQARALLAGRGPVRRHRRAPVLRPLPGRQAPEGRAGGHGGRRGRAPASRARSPSWRRRRRRERAQLLYDLTSLQRHANTLYGFSARRTLGAAQKLYEEHKALTYPRTNSRFLTGDLVADIRPTAELVGHNPAYRKGAEYVTSLEKLPLGRVVNDKKVEDHHAIIPTKSEHDLGRMGADELKVYDLVAKRFLAVFHPDAVFERTRVETTVAEHVFRTSGRRLVVAGWKAVYGDEASVEGGRGRLRRRPVAAQARAGRDAWRRATSSRCARRPSRRGATPRRRCSRRWRAPARTSRTTSCARR